MARTATKNTDLTARQTDVLLAYLIAGTTAGAAEALGGISPRTVKAHLDVVARKLGAADARDLLRAALDAEIVSMTFAGRDIRTIEWQAA